MKVVHSPRHSAHAPPLEFELGRLVPFKETPSRVDAILRALQSLPGFDVIPGVDHGKGPVERIHSREYLEYLSTAYQTWVDRGGNPDGVFPDVFAVREFANPHSKKSIAFPRDGGLGGQPGYFCFDMTGVIAPGTYVAAYEAAQVALTAADIILTDSACIQSAFALCRPPGHHAHKDLCGGYCFLNNAAIAAQYLIDRSGAKVCILDIDYHHGNGTQAIFYDKENPLYVSLHGTPDYPMYWGSGDESGEGKGLGFNINVPLPVGTRDGEYLTALRGVVEGVISRFDADVVVVSVGVDTFKDDVVGNFLLTSECFSEMGRIISLLGKPTLFVMEGGYDIATVGTNVANLLRGFEQMRVVTDSETPKPPRLQPTAEQLRALTDIAEQELLELRDVYGSQAIAKVKVLSWNILAQCLIRSDQFPYVTAVPGVPSPLSVKTRSPLIVRAIAQTHMPHIALLQEVDASQWAHRLLPPLRDAGYDSRYFKKDPEKSVGHGLAVLWQESMFECVLERVVRFDNNPLVHPTSITPHTFNIGCLVALKCVDKNLSARLPGLIVSNHHLFWWVKAKYEKLRQIYILLEEVKKVYAELSVISGFEDCKTWPHVMGGDFNTTPLDTLYRVLTSASALTEDEISTLNPVPMTKPSRSNPEDTKLCEVQQNLPTANDVMLTPTFLVDSVRRNGIFKSAYARYRDIDIMHPNISSSGTWDGEPSFTKIDEWRGTLDYIMFRECPADGNNVGKLDVGRLLKIPDPEWLEPGLPNLRFPSDHLPIMAEFIVV
ncbi:hypothetical protein HDU84_007808 [Entophlyctis sp. JEL0112]|nr:hypothetical protein HDU84_007808 [Entophlyctis sp. JEL0112]